MRVRRKLIGALIAAAALTGAYVGIPMAVRSAVEGEARKAGYEIKVRSVHVGAWKVSLEGVDVSGRGVKAKAETVDINVDRSLNPTAIRAAGVEGEVKHDGEEKVSGAPPKNVKRVPIVVERAKLKWSYGRHSASLIAKRIERDEVGRISFTADVNAESPSGTVKAKGLSAKGVEPGKPMDMMADEVSINRTEVELPSTSVKAGARKIPKLSLRARKAEVASGGWKATMQGSQLSYEDGVASARAESAKVEGVAEFKEAEASVRPTPQGIDFKASAKTVETRSERLSKAGFTARSVTVAGTLKTGESPELTGAVKLGGAAVRTNAKVTKEELSIVAEMAEVGCQGLLESVPTELVPKLVPGTKMTGTIAWKVEVHVDLPERRKPSVSMWVKNRCVVQEVPRELRVERLKKPFKREVYAADGSKREVLGGPGTESWTPIEKVSPYLPIAIQAMEDPGFPAHRGFLIAAFENSMEQNISAGRFVRGGSTITMQLAKNLWLAREKTLSRKLQEAVLTTMLEKEMSKQEIMEYYVNCVEFGPDVYGVKAAAQHYFSKAPSALSLSQSLFLASILPNPRRNLFGPEGKLSVARLALIRRMMGVMFDKGTVSREQRDAGLKEVPVLGEPSSGGDEEQIIIEEGGIDPSEWR